HDVPTSFQLGPPRPVQRQVAGNGQDPGRQLCLAAEAAQRLEGSNEGVLGEILRGVLISHHSLEEAIDAELGGLDEGQPGLLDAPSLPERPNALGRRRVLFLAQRIPRSESSLFSTRATPPPATRLQMPERKARRNRVAEEWVDPGVRRPGRGPAGCSPKI